MAVELVTGYSGTEHVSSSDDGARQAGTVGTGMYVLETVEDPLAATLENANTVTVGPGDVLINGRHVRLTGSTTFAVPVGTQGMQTSNLLVLRYSVFDDGTEKVEAVTLTGEPAASDPADPALATGSVLDGDSPVDMPLYRVVTTGIESAQPVRLFETVPPISALPGVGDNVLDVAHGGTGMTSNPSVLVNLSSTSADDVFQASPRPGVTGTLPASKGGTGQTSLRAARNAMGLGNTAGALPVANGGTGATSAAAARSNLGITPANIGAAASSHNHSASQITSGTLAVARGGTGVTANPSILVNLASTSAASVFAASPRPGITGTLPVSHGGTGATGANAGSLTGTTYRRWGKVVSLTINTTTNVSAWGDVTLGTLPSGYRPAYPVIFPVLVENQGLSIRGIANPDGSVHLIGVGGTAAGSNGKYGSCAFVTA